jgi:hypothetical protein
MTAQYRLAPGTLTAAALTADSGSVIANWTTALTSGGWIIASDRLVTPYVERFPALDGSYGTVGRPHHLWRIARMNDAMWTVLLTELTDESTAVTIRTYNRLKSGGAGWETYNCRAIRPAFLSEELHPKQGNFFVDVPIRFINMAVAASGV